MNPPHPNPPPDSPAAPVRPDIPVAGRAEQNARLLADAISTVAAILRQVDDVSAQVIALGEPTGLAYDEGLASTLEAHDAQDHLADAALALRSVRRILTGQLASQPELAAAAQAQGVYACPGCDRRHTPWCPPYGPTVLHVQASAASDDMDWRSVVDRAARAAGLQSRGPR